VRLLDIGIDPFSFTDSLLGILGQRLARRLCTKCRQARFATDEEIRALAEDYCYASGLDAQEVAADWSRRHGPQLRLYEAQGCDECRQTGYRGRVGMYELLRVTPDMRHSILQRVGAAELQRMAIAGGMRTMKQDGIEKCFSGLTDIHEVHAAAV
jgi:type II secretory ATPase GspE/PulE/Tfp pilus assembly ATPase PilB-like protein